MSFDPVKNFGIVSLSVGYASGVTSVVLSSGDGSKLPQPSSDGAFNLVWYNATDYSIPFDDPNVEIVRCTARTTDNLTIIRAQESTSDVSHNTSNKSYKFILALTKKTYDDIVATLHTQGTDQGLDTGGSNAVVVADVKDAVTKKHTQNTDTGLDTGGSNPITAAQIVAPKYLVGDIAALGGLTNEVSTKDINSTNLLTNGNFELWTAGTTSAPDGWISSGVGSTIAREGTIKKIGSYSAKHSRVDNNAYLMVDTNSIQASLLQIVAGKTVSLSVWCYATVANRARIRLRDITNGTSQYSSFHTGDSTWQQLTSTLAIGSNCTRFIIELSIETADTTVYWDGVMLVEGSVPFAFSEEHLSRGGTIVTEVDETKFSHKLPVMINDTLYYIMLTQS